MKYCATCARANGWPMMGGMIRATCQGCADKCLCFDLPNPIATTPTVQPMDPRATDPETLTLGEQSDKGQQDLARRIAARQGEPATELIGHVAFRPRNRGLLTFFHNVLVVQVVNRISNDVMGDEQTVLGYLLDPELRFVKADQVELHCFDHRMKTSRLRGVSIAWLLDRGVRERWITVEQRQHLHDLLTW